jgi:hypothetical protein
MLAQVWCDKVGSIGDAGGAVRGCWGGAWGDASVGMGEYWQEHRAHNGQI